MRNHIDKKGTGACVTKAAIFMVGLNSLAVSPALAGAILDELSYRYQLARGRRPPAPTRENPTTTGQ